MSKLVPELHANIRFEVGNQLNWEGAGRTMRGKGGEVVDSELTTSQQSVYKSQDVVQVNIPAESGEMGVLANHVASIEQLKPGLIEVIEESGGSKQFFRKHVRSIDANEWLMYHL